MSTQYKGSVLSSTEQPTSSSTATGIWATSDVMQAQKADAWPTLAIPIEYLVLAGGGAGTCGNSGNIGNGGGGAGGILASTLDLRRATAYTFAVGAGATGTTFGLGNVAANGSNSGIIGAGIAGGGVVANGGGSAKAYISGSFTSNSGGCGSGGTYNNIAPGAGTAGPPRQGYDGAAGLVGGNYNGGGGGGTGANGVSGASGGTGGAGSSKTIMGSAIFYGGGGGGGALGSPAGAGGTGGGGTGGVNIGGTAGTANLGGGGGGAGGSTATGANGGSGVIIVAYLSSYPSATAASAGLIINGSAGNITPDTASRAGYKIYRITAGTGTITW